MKFCKHIEKIRDSHRKKKNEPAYTYSVFSNAQAIPADVWATCNGNFNLFLSLSYLQTIENLHANAMYFRYVIVYKDNKPAFIAYFQISDFTADAFSDTLQPQLEEMQSKRSKLVEHYLDFNKNCVVLRIVTCGNNFISGAHAFSYNSLLEKEEAIAVLKNVVEMVGKSEKKHGKIAAIVVKDFEDGAGVERPLLNEKFIEFFVEPNMVVHIPKKITSLDDYISLFSKKYRNRAKAIFKCADGIEKHELSLAEIKKQSAKIYSLYEQIYNNAKFKVVKVAPTYFAEMKQSMQHQFVVSGYFKDGKLIAFKSAFILEDRIEAHFIGFDYELNKEHECYQNLLYDFIEFTIQNKKTILQLGRTAAEIKSTVGAKPQALFGYIKPQNHISKAVLKPFISFLQPSEWTPRNPFKEDVIVNSNAIV